MADHATIGTLRETALHAALKQWYARPGDHLEVKVDGYIADILREDVIVEIQTHNFAALKRKLTRLLEQHCVHLVYPIAQDKWIVRIAADGETPLSRRKSPHHGSPSDVFLELVSFPELVAHPNFSLEVLMIHEEELRQSRATRRPGRWARDWQVSDRRLIQVADRIAFVAPRDFRRFIPDTLPQPFTSRDLATALNRPLAVTQKMTYCLRKMGTLAQAGKHGRAQLYAMADSV